MKKIAAACLFLALVAAPPVEAASFTISSLKVDLRDTDPGLVLWNSGLIESVVDLSGVGSTDTIKLFEIGTNESALNFEDDLRQFGINVTLGFANPFAFAGSFEGVTGGAWLFHSFGYVLWDSPVVLGGGLLELTLSNVAFGLPGSSIVEGTFKLLKEPPPRSVPEPGTLALLGVGAVAAAWGHRRRQVQ